MKDEVKQYHQRRRAFVIIPQVGIIVAQKGSIMSHEEILQSLGMPQEKVNEAIKNNPRGYFMDNTLVLYQGADIKENECWELKEENYKTVAEYFADIQKLFNINKDTQCYLGVKRGELGAIWERVHQVPITFFEKYKEEK